MNLRQVFENHLELRPPDRFGVPTLKGTNVSVKQVLEALAAGKSRGQILDETPGMTKDHLSAVYCYAAAREHLRGISRSKQLYPDHLKYYVKRLDAKNGIFGWECGDYSPAYQIRCTCGQEDLQVFKSEMPNVYARCERCNNAIVVYDLRLYRCAVCLTKPDPFERVELGCGCTLHKVFICVEYGSLDIDDTHDPNDISACSITLTCSGHGGLAELVNDETA